MNIFVAKLNFKTTSDDLRALFEQFGAVNNAKVIIDHETGKSRGFGFVEMANETEANAAIEELDGAEFQTRVIAVKVATPQQRPQGGNGNGGGNFSRGGGNFNRGGGNNRY